MSKKKNLNSSTLKTAQKSTPKNDSSQLTSKQVKGCLIFFAIFILIWIIFLVIATTTNSNRKAISSHSNSLVTESINLNEDSLEKKEIFANDEVVNRFITEFNEKTLFEITNVSKGNIRTKYFGYANNRYLEMLNANDALAESFCLTINGGFQESDKEEMIDVFKEAIKVFDDTISDDELNEMLMNLAQSNKIVDYSIGQHIKITYVPIQKLSYVSPCRIDVYVDNYK